MKPNPIYRQITNTIKKHMSRDTKKDFTPLVNALLSLVLKAEAGQIIFPMYYCLRRIPIAAYGLFLEKYPIEAFNRRHQALSLALSKPPATLSKQPEPLPVVVEQELQNASQFSEKQKSVYIFTLLLQRKKYRHVIAEEDFNEVLESANRSESHLKTWLDNKWSMPINMLLELAFLDYQSVIHFVKNHHPEENWFEFAMMSAPDFSNGRIGSPRIILAKYAAWIDILTEPQHQLDVAKKMITIARAWFGPADAAELIKTLFETQQAMIAVLPPALFADLHDWVHPAMFEDKENNKANLEQKPRWSSIVKYPDVLKRVILSYAPAHQKKAFLYFDDAGRNIYHHALTQNQKAVIDIVNETLSFKQRLSLLSVKKCNIRSAIGLLTYEKLSWVFGDQLRTRWLSLVVMPRNAKHSVPDQPHESFFKALLDNYTDAEFFEALRAIKNPIHLPPTYHYVYRLIKERLVTVWMNDESPQRNQLTPDFLRGIFPLPILYSLLHRRLKHQLILEDLFYYAESNALSLEEREPDDFDSYLLVRYQLRDFLNSPPIVNHLKLFAVSVDPLALQLKTALDQASDFTEAHTLIREYINRSKNAFTKTLKNSYNNPKAMLEDLFKQVKHNCALN